MSKNAQQMPVGSLPMDVRMELERLLSKEAHALEPVELDFLKARRVYLTSDQRAYYKIDEEGEPELVSRPALKARLKELGVEFNGNSSNADLQALIEEAEKAQEDAEKEEDEEKDETGEDIVEPMLSKTKAKAELKKLDIDFADDASQEELNELLKEARSNA